MSFTPEGFKKKEPDKPKGPPSEDEIFDNWRYAGNANTITDLTHEFLKAEGNIPDDFKGSGPEVYRRSTTRVPGSTTSSYHQTSLGDKYYTHKDYLLKPGDPDGKKLVDGKPAVTLYEGSHDKDNVARLGKLIEERTGAKVHIRPGSKRETTPE